MGHGNAKKSRLKRVAPFGRWENARGFLQKGAGCVLDAAAQGSLVCVCLGPGVLQVCVCGKGESA